MHKKGTLVRKFYTGGIVVVRKQVNIFRKDGVAQKLLVKIKVPYIVL